MWIKRALIYIPLILVLLLVQSFFWVPTYDKQGVGNPERLLKFIQSSSGDARILNPILSADSASSDINEKVFDGLIGYDDQLELRPRLATGWTLYEEATLNLRMDFTYQGKRIASSGQWLALIKNRLKTDDPWAQNIRSVEIVPSQKTSGSVSAPVRDAQGQPVLKNGRPQIRDIGYTLKTPEKLKFTLNKIDQHFFDPIKTMLGPDYFDTFPHRQFIQGEDPQQSLQAYYQEILPVLEHNPILIFDLRRGVRFHDGHEFDAGDVLFTYRALMNPKNASPRTSDFEPVKTVEMLDRYKIKFVYKRLFSPAINAWAIGILPEHLLNEEALQKEARSLNLDAERINNFNLPDSRLNRNPIGTGPFIFKEWKGDEMIRLVRNEDYWESPPEYHEYIMRIIPDSLTREMEFYSGAADDYQAEPHQVARLKDDDKYQNFSTVGFNYSYIGYNLRNPLFASREVRTALGMAINTDQIIQYVLYNEGERVTGPFAKITDWYDHDVQPLPYDPKGALKILHDQGWQKNSEGWLEKDGRVFEFNLITNNGNALRKSILTIVQSNWRKLGIKCNTQLFEWAVFLKDFVNARKFDALVLGWSTGIDPDQFQIWHSSQTGPRQLNFVGYKNPEADRLIVAIRQEYDKARQVEMTRQLHRMIARDQPYTFLYVGKATRLLDKKIVMVERGADGQEKYVKIYPTRGGNISYYFNKWRKLSSLKGINIKS